MEAVRFVRGTPTAEEVAALVGVLLLRRPAPAAEPARPSVWRASGRPGFVLPDGRPARRGPAAWRISAWVPS